jgi:hypothetical protein
MLTGGRQEVLLEVIVNCGEVCEYEILLEIIVNCPEGVWTGTIVGR